jgi:hypothetical protein
VSCFGVSPPDAFLKTHLVLFSKQGSIRYTLHSKKTSFFCFSPSFVFVGPIHLVMLNMAALPSSAEAIYLPRALNVKKKLNRRTKTRFFMPSRYILYMQKRRKPKRKKGP